MLNKILHWSYILGYSRWLAPRWLRKLLAGSEFHRSWLSGYLGVFEQKGERLGVCDRQWFSYRCNK